VYAEISKCLNKTYFAEDMKFWWVIGILVR